MPSSLTCPEDPELLAVASGEEPSEAFRAHLAGCSRCREQVDRYRVEMELLRAGASDAPLAPSTMSGLDVDHGLLKGQAQDPDATQPQKTGETPIPRLSRGQAHDPDATAPRESAGATTRNSSAPETDLGFAREAGQSDEPPLPAAIGKYLVIGRFPATGQAEVFRVVHPQLRQERVLKLAKRAGRRGWPFRDHRGRQDPGRPGPSQPGPGLRPRLPRDRPYLVMEYIRGRTLEHSPARIHCQSSPGRGAGGEGLPRRPTLPTGAESSTATSSQEHPDRRAGEPRSDRLRHGAICAHAWSDDRISAGGTFAFMAPEQARVESPEEQKKVGPRSDVFALGAVLYFLLTGKAPVSGAKLARIHGPRPRVRLRPQGP